MSTYNYKMFKYFSRKFHLTQQSAPPDVLEAFTKYTGGAPTMSAEQLWLFLVEHQGETECSEEESIRIVEYMQRFRQHSGTNTDKNRPSNDAQSDDSNGLTLDDFFDFLLLDSFNYPVKPKQVHHDMNLPLSHYFIDTGHNSYLTGNQLSSDCSDVPIIKALHRGVRVIELDLWPNSAKDGIEVVHGRTLTAPVSLTQCYVSIREHAFAASQYPVIITLEDHLTPDLQAMVAELTTQIFGDLLHYPDQTEGMTEFPTPESLKGRILISTRPPTEFLGSKQFRDKDYERESPDEGGSSPNPANNGVEADEKSNNASDGDEEDSSANGKKPSTTEYKRLITIHAGKPKGHLRDSLKTDGHVRRLSLSEQELEKASSSYGTDIVRYTQKHIIRVYPKGTRVNSSNYRPHIGWIYGAQMVALNMQGYGKSLWYMQGMFRANGGCGYVRKPSFLMEKNDRGEDFDPKRLLPVKKILKVKVHMGTGWSSDFSKTHFDTFSPPDFYIRVGIVGVAADKMSKKTKVIFDNWFPVWDEEFEFPLTVPELALLSVEVREYDKHEKDDFGGQTCLPIFELRPGFRAVPLYDERGDKFQNVKLLMRFQFR